MDLFVYGTLTEPARVASLVDAYVFVGPVRIDGLRPVEGRHLTLAPGGSVAGRVLRTDEVDAIDAYEGVGDGLYVRVPIPFEDGGTVADASTDDRGGRRYGGNEDGGGRDAGDRDALQVYVGDPDRLGVDVDWPGEGELSERVARYVAAEGVVARPVHSSAE